MEKDKNGGCSQRGWFTFNVRQGSGSASPVSPKEGEQRVWQRTQRKIDRLTHDGSNPDYTSTTQVDV